MTLEADISCETVYDEVLGGGLLGNDLIRIPKYVPKTRSIGRNLDETTAVAVVVPDVCSGHMDGDDAVNPRHLPAIGLINRKTDSFNLYLTRRALSDPAEVVNYISWSAERLARPPANLDAALQEFDWFHAPDETEGRRCYVGHYAIKLQRPEESDTVTLKGPELALINYLSHSGPVSRQLGQGYWLIGKVPYRTFTGAFSGKGITPGSGDGGGSAYLGPAADADIAMGIERTDRGFLHHMDHQFGVVSYYREKSCALRIGGENIVDGTFANYGRVHPGTVYSRADRYYFGISTIILTGKME